jgi:hypothetical protein
MRRLTLTAVVVALLTSAGFAAAATTKSQRHDAVVRCHAQKKALGTKAFRQLYGTNKTRNNAFSRCVAKLARQESENDQNASQQCRAERSADEDAFVQKYGTNHNKRNAFGKCVSQKAKEQSEEEQDETINAAKACLAERKDDPAAFRDKYGTNHNKRNALGKCVSAQLKAQH